MSQNGDERSQTQSTDANAPVEKDTTVPDFDRPTVEACNSIVEDFDRGTFTRGVGVARAGERPHKQS